MDSARWTAAMVRSKTKADVGRRLELVRIRLLFFSRRVHLSHGEPNFQRENGAPDT